MGSRRPPHGRHPAGIAVHCPACHRTVLPVPILWGYPTPDGMEAAERGDVVLGGCLVGDLDPTHVCPTCAARLMRFEDGEYAVWTPPWFGPVHLDLDGPPVH